MSNITSGLFSIGSDKPSEGAKFLGWYALSLTANNPVTVDFSQLVMQGQISAVRTLITAASSTSAVQFNTFTFSSGQVIMQPHNRGLIIPVLMPNPLIFQVMSTSNSLVLFGFANITLPSQQIVSF